MYFGDRLMTIECRNGESKEADLAEPMEFYDRKKRDGVCKMRFESCTVGKLNLFKHGGDEGEDGLVRS